MAIFTDMAHAVEVLFRDYSSDKDALPFSCSYPAEEGFWRYELRRTPNPGTGNTLLRITETHIGEEATRTQQYLLVGKGNFWTDHSDLDANEHWPMADTCARLEQMCATIDEGAQMSADVCGAVQASSRDPSS